MNMLRKTLACLIVALSFVAPMAATPQVEANPPASAPHRIYEVYYRSSPHARWVDYGGYYHRHEADQAARWFRYYGYEAFVRVR